MQRIAILLNSEFIMEEEKLFLRDIHNAYVEDILGFDDLMKSVDEFCALQIQRMLNFLSDES